MVGSLTLAASLERPEAAEVTMADMTPVVRPVLAAGCVVITDQEGDEDEEGYPTAVIGTYCVG